MIPEERPIATSAPAQNIRFSRTFKISLAVACGVSAFLLLLLFFQTHKKDAPIAQILLADGRLLLIEGVTYGTNHAIGNERSQMVRRFYRWLPGRWVDWLEPELPLQTIDLARPGLVVWVYAINPATGKKIDCQGIRAEFVDERGDLFGEENGYCCWFGTNFCRVGHAFVSYPKNEQKLTLQISCWNKSGSNRIELANPHFVQPETWTGGDLPQKTQINGLEIVLAGLKLHTNGGPKKYWETPARYWKPAWELRRDGQKLKGWLKPEWTAEDPLGNIGQFSGVHQPVLKYSATFYPSPTNLTDAVLVDSLPLVKIETNTVPWNQKSHFENTTIEALGFFPAGSYVFREGQLLTNPPVSMGPTRGGAPTGWTGQSQQITPFKMEYFHGHYSITNPIIYLRMSGFDPTNHLAVRLRDEQGRLHVAKPDSGGVDGIYPFIVKLPLDVTNVVPEIVVLKPVTASFMVKTPDLPNP